jgi:hypothetical protein
MRSGGEGIETVAKTRDVLGHVRVEKGARKRKCHHSRGKHHIPGDTPHLTVKGGSFGARKNYCRDCAKQILDAARGRIGEMEAELTA